ncbi:hypothetical protein PAHAL_9G521100 [Panicum hallii]|uniref:Uncharacterized protein n=1 Tax=Panicum hallii TaxID=206008 RepID=A0A2T8I5F8_9POAL|nr:hypothetical protein PAHAL_9G521100 [Panicum hallii]
MRGTATGNSATSLYGSEEDRRRRMTHGRGAGCRAIASLPLQTKHREDVPWDDRLMTQRCRHRPACLSNEVPSSNAFRFQVRSLPNPLAFVGNVSKCDFIGTMYMPPSSILSHI